MAKYLVTAPMVILKVRDVAGAPVLNEFYEGAVVPDGADQESVDRLVGKGMLQQTGAPVEEAPAEPPAGPGPTKPAGNGSRDDWAAYAASQGAPEWETASVDQGGLSRDDLRAKYGA